MDSWYEERQREAREAEGRRELDRQRERNWQRIEDIRREADQRFQQRIAAGLPVYVEPLPEKPTTPLGKCCHWFFLKGICKIVTAVGIGGVVLMIILTIIYFVQS